MNGDAPQFLTTIEVSRLLDLSPDRIRQLERSGALPANRTETGVRIFLRSTVEDFRHSRDQHRREYLQKAKRNGG